MVKFAGIAGRSEWSSLQGLQAKMLKSTGKRRKRNLSESQRLSMIDSDDDVKAARVLLPSLP